MHPPLYTTRGLFSNQTIQSQFNDVNTNMSLYSVVDVSVLVDLSRISQTGLVRTRHPGRLRSCHSAGSELCSDLCCVLRLWACQRTEGMLLAKVKNVLRLHTTQRLCLVRSDLGQDGSARISSYASLVLCVFARRRLVCPPSRVSVCCCGRGSLRRSHTPLPSLYRSPHSPPLRLTTSASH